MTESASQPSIHPSTRARCGGLGSALLLALALSLPALAQRAPEAGARAAAERASEGSGPAPPEAQVEGEPLFTLGPLEYRPARGLRFGDSGLTIGGFAVAELERPNDAPTTIALDSVNLIALYEPVESFAAFAELEIGDTFTWQSRGGGVASDPRANFERLYAEVRVSDAFAVRFGKFQTPIGRWNLAPEEPFTWTANEPLIVERGFDEHQTGLAIHGSFYPEKRVVSYWLYGQIVGAFSDEPDARPIDRSVGGRLEYGEARGGWSVGASLLASERNHRWATTAGLDAKWRAGARLELSSEVLVSVGDLPDRRYWGAFVEAAYPLDRLSPALAKLYVVGRVEHFDAHGERAAQIFGLGLAWLPEDWLVLKAGYRAATHDPTGSLDELKLSVSVLF